MIKLSQEDFLSENMDNLLDKLEVLADHELETLETMCNILITERMLRESPKLLNDFITSQLEE